VSFANGSEKDKLGKDFDTRLQVLGRNALVDAVSFGFWNYDHIEAFRLTEFAPLYDEETGALSAGVRFWQIDPLKPLRATLYELDGYTEYICRNGEGLVYRPKRAYVLNVRVSPSDGVEIVDGENYPSFPIVPLWGNQGHQSELVGIREQIDAYDLIKSGFCNTVDEASYVYWTIQNAGGMDDIDLAKFIERMRTVKAAAVEDDGARAESHTMDAPYASREALLERLRNDLYDDFMALDSKKIAGGAVTATQIKAAYEPLNNKADMYEYCIRDFLKKLFVVAGVDDEVSFTRSMMINMQENVQTIVQAAQYLPEEYITRKILETFGDGDKTDEIIAMMQADEFRRMADDTRRRPDIDG
jgi:SPP1 family phage portal protein